MIKKALIIIFIIGSLAGTSAQFETNRHYAGPMLGLSFLGSTLQIGGGYEYGLHIDNFGDVGIGGLIRYWAYKEDIAFGEVSYSDFLIGLQGNYHFNIHDERFDPWAGIVLAYDAGSVEFTGAPGIIYNEPSYGGVWAGFHGGLRYWINPNLAISGRIGFGTLGYGALDFGVDFKF